MLNNINKNFAKIPNWFTRNNILSANEKMIIQNLLINKDGFDILAKELYKRCGITQKTGSRIIKLLESKKLLDVKRWVDDKKHQRVTYSIINFNEEFYNSIEKQPRKKSTIKKSETIVSQEDIYVNEEKNKDNFLDTLGKIGKKEEEVFEGLDLDSLYDESFTVKNLEKYVPAINTLDCYPSSSKTYETICDDITADCVEEAVKEIKPEEPVKKTLFFNLKCNENDEFGCTPELRKRLDILASKFRLEDFQKMWDFVDFAGITEQNGYTDNKSLSEYSLGELIDVLELPMREQDSETFSFAIEKWKDMTVNQRARFVTEFPKKYKNGISVDYVLSDIVDPTWRDRVKESQSEKIKVFTPKVSDVERVW